MNEPAPASPGSRLVEVQKVTKTFGTGAETVTALDDISMTISASEFFTLLGPSGCGKTTLLRLLAGFVHPDRGAVLLDGKHVADDPPNKRPVNTVFQSYALFPHMSVAQNVAFGLERQGLPRPRIKARVAEMLRLVRLESLAARRPAELSGGQQQRVALARALAPGPKLLLLDEPLSALDLKLRRSMQLELKRLQRETGVTFLLVTHDQEEAFSVSDRIAVMDQGRILQIGTPHEIYAHPCCSFVADFTGANVVPGHLAGLPSLYAAVRPGDVMLDVDGAGLKGRVVDFTYLGARTSCVVALDAGITITAEVDHLPHGLAAGAPVTCRFAPGAPVALAS